MATAITKLARTMKLKKIDAKGPLVVEISRRDVDRANIKDPQSCAFACAVRRSDPKIKAAFFFRTCAWLQYSDKLVRYLLPESVSREIVAFDRNKGMEPGRYHLTPPHKSQRMSQIKKRALKRPGRHQPGNTKIKRKFRHEATNVRDVKQFSTVA